MIFIMQKLYPGKKHKAYHATNKSLLHIHLIFAALRRSPDWLE